MSPVPTVVSEPLVRSRFGLNTFLMRYEKLNGINFLDWFRNLRIVLKQERKEYVIAELVPDEPTANAPRAVKDKFKKHVDDMLDVSCLLLATMSPEIQKQHEDMNETSKALFQCKMSEGSLVGAHVIKMMGYIQTLKKLGFPLKDELATDVILQSLLDSFKPFALNFIMNEINKTLPQLLGMLRTAESDLKKNGSKSIIMVREAKGKKKTKSKGNGNSKPKGNDALKHENGISKEAKFFYCEKSGHWKRNCPLYLEKVKKSKANGASSLELVPDEPTANAPRADKDKFKKHVDDMLDVSCLMLATMSPEIQKQHEDMNETSKALFQCKMSEGSLVGAHVIKMMGYIQTLKKLGLPLKDELATDVILQFMPDSFKPFALNFIMNEISKTLPQLLGMLRTAESDLKKNGSKSILMVREAKGKKKTKSKGNGNSKPKGNDALKHENRISKEAKFFYCEKSGHWKRNNPLYLEKVKKSKANGASSLELVPDEPTANAPRADKDKFKKHVDDMLDVSCLMLATMSPEIQKQHEDMNETSKALFQCKMSEGSLVGAHVIKMMGYIQTLKKLGFPLKDELATDVILQSLPDSFKPFALNFIMNEINKTLPQLLGMLRTAESDLKKNGSKSILMVREAKGKKKTKSKGNGNSKPKGKDALKPENGISKEAKFFYCEKSGHWKRNCPLYLEKVKKSKANGASSLGINVIDDNI
ncbi:hypothetical protein V6N12_057334 [Hibiscus sabdariffa]|uniref:CCHC-type domain-containing protein n=1 Tax=Hibiscus sabdariffa TaxID=183260 RepID=A0ABR2DBJ7_9ROSI